MSTHIYRVHALIVKRVDLTVGEQAIGEQRQEDELGKS